ncbi:helix-turn-helix domain-containing protein [Amycolatopsis sp. NBC_00438]|uniref:helix-turn-helix domain-containing protein n=1 Tax=Amycolatopsis sp. NBC_00438 TaxID=2903558 RepID=UPI002E23B687
MRLEIRHLELVVEVAEAGSLRRAAARLHLSQPAVTTQLKRIEQFVGGALFIRSTDGVVPTHTARNWCGTHATCCASSTRCSARPGSTPRASPGRR